MFLGREKELDAIRETLSLPSCCVLVYGKPRVGKTTLLLRALEGSADRTLYYVCRPTSLKRNAERFADDMLDGGVIDFRIAVNDFYDAFALLDRLGETLNVVIDEYQLLKEADPSADVDDMFRRIAEGRLSHMRLFICGSHPGMMRGLLAPGNPLSGSFRKVVELEEWDYREAAAAYPDLSARDKAAFYSVFGGSPYMNSLVDPAASLEDNIKRIFLKKDGAAFVYAEMTMPGSYRNFALRSFTEIRERMGLSRAGGDTRLSGLLKEAASLGLVRKTYPVNRPGNAKKAVYEMTDNALRFYYGLVRGDMYALNTVSADGFYDRYIGPRLDGYVASRFSDICRRYLVLRYPDGETGTYCLDVPRGRGNGRLDVAVKRESVVDVYIPKYLPSEMTARMVEDETRDIREIEGLPVDKVGFISVNGFEDGCEGVLITGDDLYG